MIGGIVILYIAVWFYQSAIKAKTDNAFKWVAIGVATFFVFQYMWVWMNVFSLAAEMEDRSVAIGGDRPGVRDRSSGLLTSVYLELMPVFIGFLAAAVVRLQFVLKEKMTLKNLFSDLNIFKSLKKSEVVKKSEAVKEPEAAKEPPVTAAEPEAVKEPVIEEESETGNEKKPEK